MYSMTTTSTVRFTNFWFSYYFMEACGQELPL